MNWETLDEKDNGIAVKNTTEDEPQLIAVFDGDEKVTKSVDPIQIQEARWLAEGYRRAKKKYE